MNVTIQFTINNMGISRQNVNEEDNVFIIVPNYDHNSRTGLVNYDD